MTELWEHEAVVVVCFSAPNLVRVQIPKLAQEGLQADRAQHAKRTRQRSTESDANMKAS